MTTRYTINPSLRLCTWCLVVGWYEVKDSLLQSESIFHVKEEVSIPKETDA